MNSGSTWHQFTTWFTTKGSWLGANGAAGVLHLLVQHIWISALSLAITCAIGIPLAAALTRWRGGGLVVTSVANAARSIPIVGVLLLLAVGPIGIGTKPAVIALVIFALPPILTNTYTGITGVDTETTRAATGMGMTRLQVLLRVELPLAIPLIATGLRLATVQIWATATIAAIIGSGGLGQLITVGYATQYYGEVYGGVVVIAVTAIALDTVMQRAQRVVRRRYGAAAAIG
ncbi:MAG TPA: ABC transporter permease [Mycobacteriales bacterium]|jgi:osmoprotectant transport system permease protein|nr:ABC transporter permease [Mycobacteriales bacterium]